MTAEATTGALTEQDLERLLGRVSTLRAEIAKVIVGQHEAVDQLLVGLFAGGSLHQPRHR